MTDFAHMISLMAKQTATIAACIFIFGCGGNTGPAMGTVHGRVTLDGSPLGNAMVVFTPEHGRPANSMTNENGEYSLVYSQSAKGAAVGQYTVQITTGREEGYAEGVKVSDAVKEVVPDKYNSKSELKVEVKAGDNVHNFDLQSK
jgi:hypothetical protein